MDLTKTLEDRAKNYGDIPYSARAATSQAIKAALRNAPGWDLLTDSQKEAMEMIAHKQARIVGGAAKLPDGWHDIGGYAALAEQELTMEEKQDAAPFQPAPAPVKSPELVAPKPVAAVPAAEAPKGPAPAPTPPVMAPPVSTGIIAPPKG